MKIRQKISQLIKNNPQDIFNYISKSIKGVDDTSTFLPSPSSFTVFPVGPPGGPPGRPEGLLRRPSRPGWPRGQGLKSFTFRALIPPGSNDGSGEANLPAVVIPLVPEQEATSTSRPGLGVPGEPGNPLRVAGFQFIRLDGVTSIRNCTFSGLKSEEFLSLCC